MAASVLLTSKTCQHRRPEELTRVRCATKPRQMFTPWRIKASRPAGKRRTREHTASFTSLAQLSPLSALQDVQHTRPFCSWPRSLGTRKPASPAPPEAASASSPRRHHGKQRCSPERRQGCGPRCPVPWSTPGPASGTSPAAPPPPPPSPPRRLGCTRLRSAGLGSARLHSAPLGRSGGPRTPANGKTHFRVQGGGNAMTYPRRARGGGAEL